jgi:hypothetical protein
VIGSREAVGLEDASTTLERIENRIAIGLLIISVIDLLFQKSAWLSLRATQWWFLGQVVFWGAAHGQGSIFMLLASPEYRALRKRHAQRGFSIFRLSAGIYFAFAAVTFGLLEMGSQWPNSTRIGLFTFSLLLSCASFHHMLRQTFGLSLRYNERKAGVLSAVELQEIRLRDGKTFQRLIAFNFVTLAATFGGFYWPAMAVPETVYAALIAIGFLTALKFVYDSYRDGARLGYEKFRFSLRVILYPVSYIAPIAAFGIITMHGIEHVFCNHQMLRRSRKATFILSAAFFATLCLLMIYHAWARSAFPTLADMPARMPNEISVIYIGLFALYVAGGPMHFVLDAYMFRMKDKSTRELIGPLLVPRLGSKEESVSQARSS